jgi:hypothetical protein
MNPRIVEALKHKVCTLHHHHQDVSLMLVTVQLEQAKDAEMVQRSTMERRSLYRSVRMEDARYVSVFLKVSCEPN